MTGNKRFLPRSLKEWVAAGALAELSPAFVDGVRRLYDAHFREAVHDRW